MKMLCSTMVDKLYKKYQEVFLSPIVEQGIAYVRYVEEVFVRDDIFHNSQLVFCEIPPPQLKHYCITLIFEEKEYEVDSHQNYKERINVRIEYIRIVGGIKKCKILGKA